MNSKGTKSISPHFQKQKKKKTESGIEEKKEYINIYNSVPNEQIAKSGVSIAIRRSLKKFITSWEYVNNRILQVNISMKGYQAVFVPIY